jgi:hypothetical protein
VLDVWSLVLRDRGGDIDARRDLRLGLSILLSLRSVLARFLGLSPSLSAADLPSSRLGDIVSGKVHALWKGLPLIFAVIVAFNPPRYLKL